ncbi:MAG: hypothetical protein ACK4N5_00850, partial [Myxococcales bacterium]
MTRPLVAALLFALAGCGSHRAPRLHADGSLRIDVPGGTLATWNRQFPAELEAAVQGEDAAGGVWA